MAASGILMKKVILINSDLRPVTLSKREFCEVFKNTFLHKKKVASVYEMQHRSEMGYSRNMIWKKMFIRLPEFRMKNFYLTKPYKVLNSVQQKLGNHRSTHRRWSIKKGVLKNFRLQLYSKKNPIQLFSSEYWEIFKKTYFEEHLRLFLKPSM